MRNRLVKSLLITVVGLLFLETLRAFGQDDWNYDILHLKNGTVVKGLLVRETGAEIEFKSIRRPPGARTVVVTTTYPAGDVESIEKLGDEDREILKAKLSARDTDGKKEKQRMESLELERAPWRSDSQGGWKYTSDHFVLESNAKEEIVRRAAVRLEQIYSAYVKFLPPRQKSAEPTRILLVRLLAEYQSMLKDEGHTILNPAFFDFRRNRVVCACDLERLGDELKAIHNRHQETLQKLRKQEADLDKEYAGSIPASLLREIDRVRLRIQKAEQKNDNLYQESTRRLFQTMYHEAFHAYLASAVYPPANNDVPRWLNEGLAQIFETAVLEAGGLRVGRPDDKRLTRIKAAVRKNDLIPLADLLKSGVKQFIVAHANENQESDRGYLNSWALAFYLTFDRHLLGTSELDQYVHDHKAGTHVQKAFEKLVGQPLDQFERDFHRYLLAIRKDGTLAKQTEK